MQSLELCHAGLKGLLLGVAGALPSKLEGERGWGGGGVWGVPCKFQGSALCKCLVSLWSCTCQKTDAMYLDGRAGLHKQASLDSP